MPETIIDSLPTQKTLRSLLRGHFLRPNFLGWKPWNVNPERQIHSRQVGMGRARFIECGENSSVISPKGFFIQECILKWWGRPMNQRLTVSLSDVEITKKREDGNGPRDLDWDRTVRISPRFEMLSKCQLCS